MAEVLLESNKVPIKPGDREDGRTGWRWHIIFFDNSSGKIIRHDVDELFGLEDNQEKDEEDEVIEDESNRAIGEEFLS